MKRLKENINIKKLPKLKRPSKKQILVVAFLISVFPFVYEFGRRHQRWGYSDAAIFIMNQKIAHFRDPDMIHYRKSNPSKQSLIMGGDFKGFNSYYIHFSSKSGDLGSLLKKVMNDIEQDNWSKGEPEGVPNDIVYTYDKYSGSGEKAWLKIHIDKDLNSLPEDIKKAGGEIVIHIQSRGDMQSKYFPENSQ